MIDKIVGDKCAAGIGETAVRFVEDFRTEYKLGSISTGPRRFRVSIINLV